jgi:hypothetical protein
MIETFLSQKRANIGNVREHVHVSKRMSQHCRNFQTRADANKKDETTHGLLLCRPIFGFSVLIGELLEQTASYTPNKFESAPNNQILRKSF